MAAPAGGRPGPTVQPPSSLSGVLCSLTSPRCSFPRMPAAATSQDPGKVVEAHSAIHHIALPIAGCGRPKIIYLPLGSVPDCIFNFVPDAFPARVARLSSVQAGFRVVIQQVVSLPPVKKGSFLAGSISNSSTNEGASPTPPSKMNQVSMQSIPRPALLEKGAGRNPFFVHEPSPLPRGKTGDVGPSRGWLKGRGAIRRVQGVAHWFFRWFETPVYFP